MREKIIEQVLTHKIIAIVRGVYGEDCLKLAQALYDGGIGMMEVTFDQSRPERLTQTSDTVRLLREKMGERMSVGAGTVTSLKMLKLAKAAGAQFIVSPDTNEEVIRATVSGGMVSMPGALTPTEIMAAYRYGADFVKVFPAGDLGPSYIKAIRAPLSHIRLLAVGGVNENNIKEFLSVGAAGAGVGGTLVNKSWIKAGEFEKITTLAREFIQNMK